MSENDPTNPYPTLHAIGLGDQLEAMERVVLHGQQGKHGGLVPVDRTADYHYAKADGHMVQAGPRYGERDVHDTGERHLVLAAIRLLMADACVEAGKVVDEE